uniref:Uncharacterized protein n=2 Tax=Oryza TaxID=4527 RepID=Q10QQ1_ORYSJ|nr:hypothetical protein LOC_Os03g08890 [Oryza sativa Japonica Group]
MEIGLVQVERDGPWWVQSLSYQATRPKEEWAAGLSEADHKAEQDGQLAQLRLTLLVHKFHVKVSYEKFSNENFQMKVLQIKAFR